MNYSNYQINEIRNLEEKSLLFETVKYTDLKDSPAFWKDIFEASKMYFSSNGLSYLMKKYPSENDLKMLVNDYGFDINHKDKGGQNLLMYVLGVKNSPRDGYPVYEHWLDYLVNNTEDLFLLNRSNENILFNFTSIHTCGIAGAHFFEFLEFVYKTKLDLSNTTVSRKDGFDFNQTNELGRNIMFYCFMNGAPKEVIEFHLEHGASLDLVDKDGYNILYFLDKYSPSGMYGDLVKNIFNKTFELLENPFQKNKYGESFIEQLMSFVKDEKVYKESKEKYVAWLKFSLAKISKNEFKLNENTIGSLQLFFNEEPDPIVNKEFNMAKVAFNANVLNLKLPSEELKKRNKFKI